MIKINLIAVRTPKDHAVIQRQVMSVIGGIVLALFIVGWWTSHAGATKAEVQGQLEGEKAKLQRLEQVAQRIEEFEKKKQRREQILDAIKKLETRKVGPRLFLDDLNMILPSDIWLTKIAQTDVTITVAGYSLSNTAIADLMRLMEASPNFSDVELGPIRSELIKGEEVKTFTLTCGWEAVKKLDDAKSKPAAPGAPAAPAAKK